VKKKKKESRKPSSGEVDENVLNFIDDYYSNIKFVPNEGMILDQFENNYIILPTDPLVREFIKGLNEHLKQFNPSYSTTFASRLVNEIARSIGRADYKMMNYLKEQFEEDYATDKLFTCTLSHLGWGSVNIKGLSSEIDWDGSYNLLMRITGRSSFETNTNGSGNKIMQSSIWMEGYISGFLKSALCIELQTIAISGANQALYMVTTPVDIEYRIREYLEENEELFNLQLLSKARKKSTLTSRDWFINLIKNSRIM